MNDELFLTLTKKIFNFGIKFSSFLRKQESRIFFVGFFWIPAFAGMTRIIDQC